MPIGAHRPGLAAVQNEPPPRRPGVYFEYIGRTGLTVYGPATGRCYRFQASGAVAAVDPRDAPSLAAVPHLRSLT